MAQRFVTKSEFNKLSAKVDNLFKEMEEQTALIKKLVNGKTANSKDPQKKGPKKPQTAKEAWDYIQPIILDRNNSVKMISMKTICRLKADDYKSWKSIHRSAIALGFEGNYEKLQYDMPMAKWETVKKNIRS